MKFLAFLAALLIGCAAPALGQSPTALRNLKVTDSVPVFSQCTGYLYGNAASAATCAATIPPSASAAGVAQYDLSRNSTANNGSISFSFSGSSFSASGTAGTTCGGAGTFNFPCLQGFNITGDTVNASSAGDVDGWQFSHAFGGSSVQGARQSVDIISTFTAATNASNANRNYVPLATYMQVNASDGGTVGTPLGAWFGANHVVRGTVTNGFEVAGQENDVNVIGSTKYRFGFSSVSWAGTEGSTGDAAYEVGSASGAGATNWVNALYLTNMHGIAPISTGGCIICTDGSADTIAKGIDLHAYTITGNFLWSNGFSVDGIGNTWALSYNLLHMVSSVTAPTIASGFCTSPSIVANGTAAFKITVGSSCAGGNGAVTLPSATNGWSCYANDVTNTTSHVIVQAGYGLTTASFQDYSRTTGAAQVMGSGDTILVQCSAF